MREIVAIIDEAKCNPGDNGSEELAEIIRGLVLSSLDTPELRGDIGKILINVARSTYPFRGGLIDNRISQIIALITKPHSPEPSHHHQENQPESYKYVNNSGNI